MFCVLVVVTLDEESFLRIEEQSPFYVRKSTVSSPPVYSFGSYAVPYTVLTPKFKARQSHTSPAPTYKSRRVYLLPRTHVSTMAPPRSNTVPIQIPARSIRV